MKIEITETFLAFNTGEHAALYVSSKLDGIEFQVTEDEATGTIVIPAAYLPIIVLFLKELTNNEN